jgi:hypothetical protein
MRQAQKASRGEEERKDARAQGRKEMPDSVLSGSSFASLPLCAFAFSS